MSALKLKNKKLLYVVLIGFFVSLFFFSAVYAGDPFGFQAGRETGLASGDVRLTTARMVRNILALLGIVALGITVYAGFTWMTAGGNDEKVGEAKKWLTRGVIGIAIILTSFSITSFVISSILKSEGLEGNGYTWSAGHYQ